MIVIKVYLWSFGDPRTETEIGRAYLYNTGANIADPHAGDYGIHIAKPHFWDEARSKFGSQFQSHRGFVPNFPRGHKNLWPLILAALRSCKLRRTKGQPVSHGDIPAREDVI